MPSSTSHPTLPLNPLLKYLISPSAVQHRKKKFRLIGAGLIAMTSLYTTQIAAQSHIGDIDDRTKAPGCYSTSNGWGVYTVKGGKSNSTDIHDPRCERRNLTPKIDTGLTLTFEATYRVDSADNTTIAQILNYDPNSSDKHKPVVFILAKDRGSEWGIYDQGNELGRVSKNSVFSIKITSYSSNGKMFSDIYLNGTKESTKQHARVGQNSQMRYGNYHHGDGTAVIRIKDVSFGHGSGSNNPPITDTPPSTSNDLRCSAGAANLSQAQNSFASSCNEFQRADCDQRSLSDSSWWLCSSEDIDDKSIFTISGNESSRIQAEDYHRAQDYDAQNRGGEYRNGEVDIEDTGDSNGRYNIGWIRPNERLIYDIAVSSAGDYTLDLRTASPNDTGLVSVFVNGGQRGSSQSVNYTGGYQQYSTMKLPIGNLPIGFHQLELRVENGGFNLNWLSLKKDSGSSSPDPLTPPSPPADDDSCADYVSGSRQELDLRNSNCLNFPFNLSSKTLQIWDSDTNTSCNFRGSVNALNGSASLSITQNYQSSSAISGTTIRFIPTNNCQFVKVRAH